MFARLLLERTYEARLSEFARNYVQETDVCVDVGANFGWYSVLFAQLVGREGTVIAVEPGSVSSVLRENLELNGCDDIVAVHEVALGSTRGKGTLEQADSANSGTAYMRLAEVGDASIDVLTLDELLADRAPSLIKIDVEGFETHVLLGASTALRAPNPPVLLLELWDPFLVRSGSSWSEVAELLEAADYDLFTVTRQGQLRLAPPGSQPVDVVAVPRTGTFRERLVRNLL